MESLCKIMDDREVMRKICRIVYEGWGDGGMWKCCGMEGNHDQRLHTL